MSAIGSRANVADPQSGQITASDPATCMACAILSACAHLGVHGERLNEKDLAWDLGIIPDAGVTFAEAMPVIRRILDKTPWLAQFFRSADPARLAEPGAVAIVAQANPGRYTGHVVTTTGRGAALGVMVNDCRDDAPRPCDPAAMRAAFAGPCICFSANPFV